MDGGPDNGSHAGLSAYEEAARNRRSAAKNLAEAARFTEEAARLTAQAAEAKRKAGYLQHRGQSFEVGAEGEVATGRVLASLRSEGWVVLNDLRWPGRLRANIDHIAIGPGGVVVIDTKNWSGRVDVRDEALRQNGQRREREVASAAEAALAIVAVLPADLHPAVRPLICLARDEWVDVVARDVQITSTGSLSTFLRSLSPVLSVTAVERTARELEPFLRTRAATSAAVEVGLPALAVKAQSRRSHRRRKAPQRTKQPAVSRARSSKSNHQNTVKTLLALAILALVVFAPASSRTAALEWFSETVGGAVADTVIPEPSTNPTTSPTPSSR